MDKLFITQELLSGMPSGERACKAAGSWFNKRFPSGAFIDDVLKESFPDEWVVWFAFNYVTAFRLELESACEVNKVYNVKLHGIVKTMPEKISWTESFYYRNVSPAKAASYIADVKRTCLYFIGIEYDRRFRESQFPNEVYSFSKKVYSGRLDVYNI